MKKKYLFFIFILTYIGAVKASDLRVIEADDLRVTIVDDTKSIRASHVILPPPMGTEFLLSEGAVVKVIDNPHPTQLSFGDNILTYLKIYKKDGSAYPGVYLIPTNVFSENSKKFISDPSLELEAATLPPGHADLCESNMEIVFNSNVEYISQLDVNGLSKNENYTFEDAENYALTGDFLKENTNPTIITREEWGAREPKKTVSVLKEPTEIIIHHTGSPTYETISSVQGYHQNANNWRDIGYNYLVAWDNDAGEWKIYEGTMATDAEGSKLPGVGSHAEGFNSKSVGIAVVGNFSPKSRWNPGGYNPRVSENQKQIPHEAIEKLGEIIQKVQKDFPTIVDIKAHGSDSSDWDHSHHEISHVPGANKDCPGEGTIHVAAAYRKRFFPEKGKKIR